MLINSILITPLAFTLFVNCKQHKDQKINENTGMSLQNVEAIPDLLKSSEAVLKKYHLAPLNAIVVQKLLKGDLEEARQLGDFWLTLGDNFVAPFSDGTIVNLIGQDVDDKRIFLLAEKWYQYAASNGDGISAIMLGNILRERGSKEQEISNYWFKVGFLKLKDAAHTRRELMLLATCYGKGEGTDINPELAVSVYLQYLDKCRFEHVEPVPPRSCMLHVPDAVKQFERREVRQNFTKRDE